MRATRVETQTISFQSSSALPHPPPRPVRNALSEMRLATLGSRTLNWAQTQPTPYRLEAFQAQASVISQLLENPLLDTLEMAYSGPGEEFVALMAEFGIAARVVPAEPGPPPYEEPPQYVGEPLPPANAAPPDRSPRFILEGAPDDDEIPPPPATAAELIQECLARLDFPEPARADRGLAGCLRSAISAVCDEQSEATKMRMLDAFVSDLARKVQPLSGDRQAVALIANLFSEAVEPVVAALDGAHVPGKEEMLSLMRFYCEQSVRADEIGNPDRARGNVPLPDHLIMELEYCLAQFSLGQAKTRNGNLQTRFPQLIAQITRVPDASAQINAYSKIYYALQTTPRTNPFDSRRFARQLCKQNILPALRNTVPPTEAVRLVRLRLLEALER